MTNFEKIKSMMIEEMTVLLSNDDVLLEPCNSKYCKHFRKDGVCTENKQSECTKATWNWLEGEVDPESKKIMSEPNIKLIKEDTDLSEIIFYNWDLAIKGKPYHVYKVSGYYHSIGGRWGNNDLWCCPRDEEPNYKSLIEFGGSPVRWGIIADDNNYIKCKWDEYEVRNNHSITITRNGEEFYNFGCRDLSYGLAKAQTLIIECEEHQIWLSEIDYDKKVVGKKIYWRDQPAIIKRYIQGQACVMIEPDGIPTFVSPIKHHNSLDVKAEIFDKNIWWFRD